MGYYAEVVRGYGYRIDTEAIEKASMLGKDHPHLDRLSPWQDLLEAYEEATGVLPIDVAVLQTGDCRGPVYNQGFLLVLENSREEADYYKAPPKDIAKLDTIIAKYNLHVDSGPEFHSDTFVG